MYVFMNSKLVVDWAKFIFNQLVDFKNDTISSARMHFPCMITTICKQQVVKGNDYKKMERLDPGPITSTFLKKSKSRSSAPKESSKAFLTTKPAPKEKKVSLLNKLFLQNVAILKCLWKSEEKRKKDKKERRQLAREVGQLKHELHWHTKYIEGENEEEGVTYVAPPQEELVDSSVDEEEEENGTEEDSEEEDEEGDGDDVED
ncbi:hypothetical protein RHGRI_000893 [Rhododendron griersonianum]|uniref:Uncharacterized protein n=2 Tax=Rhododendron griersonianum TaxID=479676 RepID=A0AAV6LIA3_9ERIC|nr:hypothetical protein RHGRI_000893 [Rhododendron griersonianum]